MRVRLSPCELKKNHFNLHSEGQGSLTKAMNSNGQRNRSSMESKLAPPCYISFGVHLLCLGPASCSFLSWVSSGCITLAGVAAESWWLQHPLFTDVTSDIFSLCQIFTRNSHILSCSLKDILLLWILRREIKSMKSDSWSFSNISLFLPTSLWSS